MNARKSHQLGCTSVPHIDHITVAKDLKTPKTSKNCDDDDDDDEQYTKAD